MSEYEQRQAFGGVIDVLEAIGAAYITPTAVVVAKLRAYESSESTRHLDDIASIVRLQGKKLDQEKIDIAAAQLGLLGVWRSLWERNLGS